MLITNCKNLKVEKATRLFDLQTSINYLIKIVQSYKLIYCIYIYLYNNEESSYISYLKMTSVVNMDIKSRISFHSKSNTKNQV